MNKLVATSNDLAFTVARLALGIMIFPHGAQKALGWFGGGGIQGTLDFFASIGIPAPLAYIAIAAEFLGGIGLIAGFMTRIAALGVGVTMAVAVAKVHWEKGFFLGDGGYEFHVLAIGLALILMMRGGGAASIDGAMSRPHPVESAN